MLPCQVKRSRIQTVLFPVISVQSSYGVITTPYSDSQDEWDPDRFRGHSDSLINLSNQSSNSRCRFESQAKIHGLIRRVALLTGKRQ